MSKNDRNAPETPATRFLRQQGIEHSCHLYEYEEHGGTAVSARELELPEHAIIALHRRPITLNGQRHPKG